MLRWKRLTKCVVDEYRRVETKTNEYVYEVVCLKHTPSCPKNREIVRFPRKEYEYRDEK